MVVLVSTDQVLAWKRERDEIANEVRKLSSRQNELTRKIEAASLFMSDEPKKEILKPVYPNPHDNVSIDESKSDDRMSLVDAITMVLQSTDKSLSNKEIKRRLSSTGFDVTRLRTSPNYYYTATKRLVDREVIFKHEDGSYTLNKISTSEGDASYDTPSEAVKDDRFIQSVEPAAQGREAVPGGGT